MGLLVAAYEITQFLLSPNKVIKGSLLVTAIAYAGLVLVKDFWSIFLITSGIFFATAMLRPALNTRLSKMAGNE
ncbi:hypothetical protein NBRC13296_15340 [Paenibacillus chitinolyticus]|uniref:hypothetical protein n=1 Tax=Paenibacillus chitinolyticus TaxID=79263 RepID=UPI003556EDA8